MGHIGGFTPLEFLFLDMGRTKKSESARKKRDQLVKDVAEQVRALQASERRADSERKMAKRAGPRLMVTFNPGNSPPPSDVVLTWRIGLRQARVRVREFLAT